MTNSTQMIKGADSFMSNDHPYKKIQTTINSKDKEEVKKGADLDSDHQVQFSVQKKQYGSTGKRLEEQEDKLNVKVNEEIEPASNFENKADQQMVYEELKNNNINTDHLIEILNMEECPSDEGGAQLSKDSKGQEQDTKSKHENEVVSQYTTQSISKMQDPNFLFLLMKNFSRGENADVIENILKKLDKEYNKQMAIIRNLNKKNDELSRENLA